MIFWIKQKIRLIQNKKITKKPTELSASIFQYWWNYGQFKRKESAAGSSGGWLFHRDVSDCSQSVKTKKNNNKAIDSASLIGSHPLRPLSMASNRIIRTLHFLLYSLLFPLILSLVIDCYYKYIIARFLDAWQQSIHKLSSLYRILIKNTMLMPWLLLTNYFGFLQPISYKFNHMHRNKKECTHLYAYVYTRTYIHINIYIYVYQ